jgi:hypothetical protein
MGFYGSVINYLTKAFSKIKIGNKIVQATNYEDEVIMQGDSWISLDAQDTTVLVEHAAPSNTIS